jgi:hypothetical protein
MSSRGEDSSDEAAAVPSTASDLRMLELRVEPSPFLRSVAYWVVRSSGVASANALGLAYLS